MLSSVEVEGLKIRVNRDSPREQLMKHLALFKEDNSQKPGVEVHAPGVRKVVFEPIPKAGSNEGSTTR